jgi:hypothetical protein
MVFNVILENSPVGGTSGNDIGVLSPAGGISERDDLERSPNGGMSKHDVLKLSPNGGNLENEFLGLSPDGGNLANDKLRLSPMRGKHDEAKAGFSFLTSLFSLVVKQTTFFIVHRALKLFHSKCSVFHSSDQPT